MSKEIEYRGLRTVIFSNKKATVGLVLLVGFAFLSIFGPVITPHEAQATGFDAWQHPSLQHLLGTTDLGEDIFSQLIYGTRISFVVALTSSFLCTIIALFVGVTAGIKGGLVDRLATSASNIFVTLPALPLMIILAAYLRVRGLIPIIAVITITGWAWDALVFRSQTLSFKEREFVQAAIVTGESDLSVVFRHIVPNMISLIASSAVETAMYAVVAEASLEFIGLGETTAISWGTMLYWSVNAMAFQAEAWWWFIPPGILIGLLGFSFSLLNFAIDEMTNPRLRR
jgi:peptide/nickel transport system permease protein